jgi:outer membrane protein
MRGITGIYLLCKPTYGKFFVMKVFSKSLFLLAFLVVSVAPSFAEIKVGVVDIQKALASSKVGQDAQKKYEIELKKSQVQIDQKKGEYEKLQSTIEKQKSSLNPKALAEKEEQLLTLEKDLKRSFQDKKEELRRENMRLVGELVGKIRKIVDAVAKENGLGLVLEKSGQGVLYADQKYDITDEVVSQFDKQ